MTRAVVVQARANSARLPGKVLFNLGGKTVLQHVLERCQAIPSIDVVVCAVPDSQTSLPIEDVAKKSGAVVVRGSENDVLQRYVTAARAVEADVILRVTSDCPLIDPTICDQLIHVFKDKSADYAANNMPPTYPHGLDCEVFSAAALEEAAEKSSSDGEREHVTPWLRQADHIARANLSSGRPELASHRWTLDYAEDLEFFRALFDRMKDVHTAKMDEIVEFLRRNPDIVEINSRWRR